MKAIAAMVCISVLSGVYMLMGGNGAALASSIAAIGTLAGYTIGVERAKTTS